MRMAVPAPDIRGRDRGGEATATPILHHSGGEFADRPHRRHPSSAAGIGPAYRGRAFPAHPPSIAGPEGRDARRTQKRLQPGARAGQCRNIIRDMKLDGAELVRHGGLGQACRRTERHERRRHRLVAGGRILRPEDAEGRCRRRASQHDALSHHGARAGRRAADGGKVVTTLRLPGEECARRALQGDGRLRHQWRQHDQAGKLSAGRLVQRHAVLCRHPGPSRGSRVCASRWRNCASSPTSSRSWASIPRIAPARICPRFNPTPARRTGQPPRGT